MKTGFDKYIYGSAGGATGTATLLADGVLADANAVEVDFGTLDLTREFIFAGRITPNTTAPGADMVMAFNWYWSDYKIATPGTNAPLLCPLRKYTTGPIVLPNLTLANSGERYIRLRTAETLAVLTTIASTTTATLTFPPGYNPKLNVGDWIVVYGGTVTGNGAQMQGYYKIAAVTHTSGANGQLVTTATYTIASTSGTLVGAAVQVERTIKRGSLDDGIGEIFRPTAQYLYVTIDRPAALTTNATTSVVLGVKRIAPTRPS